MLTRFKARAIGRRAGPMRVTHTAEPTYVGGTTGTTGHGHGHGGHGHHNGLHHTTHGATTQHSRRPSIGDKVSGAFMKLRGSLTRRPGLKAAGTRRMRGTDGRGTRRGY
jgi:hypothetical protein